MDNLSSEGGTDEEAYELHIKSKVTLAEEGFNLREFVTNSPELRKQIEDIESESCKVSWKMRWSVTGHVELIVYEEQSYTKTSLGDAQESGKSEQKILGLQWNFAEENLVFELGKVARLASECRPTKSNIAAVAAKFYEPIGFITRVQFISPVQFSSNFFPKIFVRVEPT